MLLSPCFIVDTDGKSSSRHISGSDSIHTNNSQVPLTNSVGDKIPYLENKSHSIFAIESLMYLSMLGHPNQRMNQSTNENQVDYKYNF